MSTSIDEPSAFTHFEAIPELLELALLYLPNSNLLLSQRVCRRCYDLINTSSLILSRLWYRKGHNFPLHLECNPSSFDDMENARTLFNPFITRFGMSMRENGVVYCSSKPLRYSLGYPFPRGHFNDMPGSWTTMFFTQPVQEFIAVECYDARPQRSQARIRYVIRCRNDSLVYLGELIAVLAEIWDRQQRGIDRWQGSVQDHMKIHCHNVTKLDSVAD